MKSQAIPAIAILIFFLILCALVATTGALFQPGDWYRELTKPALNPPDWIFPPVWSALYVLMAIAAWLVWLKAGFRGAGVALSFFFLQLASNAAWSWLFFGLHRIAFALADLVLLWILILITLVLFWRQRTLAGALLVPYLAWVSFAGYLNFQIWRLNV